MCEEQPVDSPLIVVDQLHYAYDTDAVEPIEALRGVSLEIGQGEMVAVIGHNGSGKSTLARCLNGLLTPTSGSVRVRGIDTRQAERLIELRTEVGIVFQHPENQFVATTVEEEIAFGPENLGVPTGELRQRVEAALQQADLAAFRRHNPRLLSAGQKARLAIASVLAMRPACLILDESTAMLDPLSRRQLLELLYTLRDEGLTIVLITHFMDEAAMADRVVVLDGGQLVLGGAGDPRTVFGHADVLTGIGLDLPPVAAVARGLARRLDALERRNGDRAPRYAEALRRVLRVEELAQELRQLREEIHA
jgi:energy-coupling factor transport system ATP-binding protein